jgi:hypothetical protein
VAKEKEFEIVEQGELFEDMNIPELVDYEFVNDVMLIMKKLMAEEYNRYYLVEDDKSKTHAVTNVLKLAGEIRNYAKQLMLYKPWQRDIISRIKLREAISQERFKKALGDDDNTIEVEFKVPQLFIMDIEQRLKLQEELEKTLRAREEEARKVLEEA